MKQHGVRNDDTPARGEPTPGPWTCEPDDVSQLYVYAFGQRQLLDEQVAEVRTSGPESEVLANARLIAAAPDLLDAARQTLAWLGDEVAAEYVGENASRDALAVAIRKAEGR